MHIINKFPKTSDKKFNSIYNNDKWLLRWLSGKNKNLSANSGDTRDPNLILGSRRFPGRGNGNPLQYSCLTNSMDRGA